MKQIIKFIFIYLFSIIYQLSFAQVTNIAVQHSDSSAKGSITDSLGISSKKYPVYGLFKDTLFYICTRTGSITPDMRAKIVSSRITQLADVYTSMDSLRLDDAGSSIDIMYKDIILMSITDTDALYENTSKLALANTYKIIISKAVLHYQQEVSLLKLTKEIGAALLILFCICLLVFYIVKLFRWIASKISDSENSVFPGIKFKNYTILNARMQINLLLSLNTFIKWITLFISIYLTIPLLFGIFPWTKNITPILFGYILTPVNTIVKSLWNYLPNFITILIILTLFYYVHKLLRFLKKEVESGVLQIPGFYADWATPTYQIIRVLLFAFLLVVIFLYLPGSDSPVFQGVSVFLGFLFTFGSAGSLSNIIAGIILTYMRLFKIGDRIKIGDVTGDVIEKSILVTRIRTIKNEIISIPNSTIMNSHTMNYSSDATDTGLIIYTTVTIGYDVPWKDIHQALIDAALKTNHILQDPKPFVLQTGLEDFYVSYQINAYIKEANKQAVIYSDLHQHIQDVCNERGIEIMSPHYRASRDGNTTTIPSQYLPDDYKAPGFNININNKSEN